MKVCLKNHMFLFFLCLFLGMIIPINSFQGGDGSAGDPYQIGTCSDLQNISSCLTCDYILISDVNCNGFDYGDGKGFMPIGNCSATGCMWGFDAFTGQLDGQGYEISNLNINRPLKNGSALFSVCSTGSEILNLGLRDVDILGKNDVGGFVGFFNSGLMSNCFSTGLINGSRWIGGLVGESYYGNIENSYSSATVVGGNQVGGLVGFNAGDVDSSYSSGIVYGDDQIGGIFGRGTPPSNCFTTATVSGATNVGGIGGSLIFGAATNTYWNNDSSNPSNVYGSGAVSGIVTIDDNLSRFYDGSLEPLVSWNTSIWSFSGIGYPALLLFQPAAVSTSRGTGFNFGDNLMIMVVMLFGWLFFV